ncbi:hypothetical protein CCHR01_17592 [Colletotrichum chrysophilum]|uniref:Uncharacterized protein n=1 Tax=Colletotrichum chrysophilum TaxID=1836956 RepID=A0AAD9A1P3_9PEZI|nr:hypothetical protein CCHR01_17592 [Colletotrichum chrysophilum]
MDRDILRDKPVFECSRCAPGHHARELYAVMSLLQYASQADVRGDRVLSPASQDQADEGTKEDWAKSAIAGTAMFMKSVEMVLHTINLAKILASTEQMKLVKVRALDA